MCSQDNKVGVHCCALAAVLAYTMGWWQWNEVEVWGQHERVTDMCLSSQIPVSPTHIQWCLLSVILLGLTGPRTDDFIVPLFPKRFPCVSLRHAHYHLCKALHSFSAHDKQPSMNKKTVCTRYSTITGDCSMLHFLWKMHSNTSSNTESFLFMSKRK